MTKLEELQQQIEDEKKRILEEFLTLYELGQLFKYKTKVFVLVKDKMGRFIFSELRISILDSDKYYPTSLESKTISVDELELFEPVDSVFEAFDLGKTSVLPKANWN